MFPWPLKRPLIFFDLETTGLDFKYDRIVEIGAIKVHPDGQEETLFRRLNPGQRIPSEVTAITGLKNEDVVGCPTFLDCAPEIASFFADADLGGYHINRFDVKVMVEEFRRAGLDFQPDRRQVVDSQVIFHQKEKRDLTAAYKFYCERELVGAHSAEADCRATLDIFRAQLKRYPDLPNTFEALAKFCRAPNERFVDAEGKFFWRDGEAVFNFGKHKSQLLRWVAQNDREYLHWLIAPDRQFPQDVVDVVYRAMKGDFPRKTATGLDEE